MDLINKTKNLRNVRTVKGYLGKKCLDSIHETENIEEERDSSSGYRQQWPHPRLEWSVLPLAALQCPRVQLNRYWAGDARWASRKAADTPQIAEERERENVDGDGCWGFRALGSTPALAESEFQV